MMVHRDKRGGTLTIDRTFRGVGRLKRASGTNDARVFRNVNAMLTALHDTGRLDILRALRDGQLAPLVVYDAYRRHDLDRLPTAGTIAPLAETMQAWIDDKVCSDWHRLSLRQSRRHLLSVARANAPVAELPALLETLRKQMAKHPRSFNLARAAAQGFVRETLKRSHALWREVAAVEPLEAKPRVVKHPASYAEIRRVVEAMDDFGFDVWMMATTGMGPGEWWGKWEWRNEGLRIHGTKREGRVRDIPHPPIPFSGPISVELDNVPGPRGTYRAFRQALAVATSRQMTPYDLRRTYANWLEAAGIPRTRRRLYLGHGKQDVTDLYEWHEVRAFLAEDAKKLAAYVEGERVKYEAETRPKLAIVSTGGPTNAS